jgi:hypothetical protein
MTARRPDSDLALLEKAKHEIWGFMGTVSVACFGAGLVLGVVGRSRSMAPNWDPTALTTALLGVGVTLFLGTQIGKSHWDDHVEAARTEVLLALTLVVCIAGAIVAWMTVPLVWPSLPEVGEGAGVGAVLSCLAGIVRPSPPKYRRARLERDLGLLREELRRLDRQLPGVPDTRGSRRAAWLRLAMLGLSPLPVAFLVGLVLAAAHRFEQLSDKLIGLPLATELVIGIVYLVVLAALWGDRKDRVLSGAWRSRVPNFMLPLLLLVMLFVSLGLSVRLTRSWGPAVLGTALIVVGVVLGWWAAYGTRSNRILLRRALRKQVVEIRHRLTDLPPAPRPPAAVVAVPAVTEAGHGLRGTLGSALRSAAGWFDGRPAAQ